MALAAGSLGCTGDGTGARAATASQAFDGAPPGRTAADLASDETFWAAVARQYDVADDVIQLENGNWGIMARPVLDAYMRHTHEVNRRNSYYARREYGDDLAIVRSRVADALGVAVEEIALTRGATEALQNLIAGYNRLRPGDSVLYADTDYHSMQYAMDWLHTRRGVEIVRIELPEPASRQAVLDTYAAALDANPRIRLILLTHLSHRSGLVVPVNEVAAMARARDADVIVDAAHSFGQMDFKAADLGADFIGFNLDKWIGAPVGVGVMYVARDRIGDVDAFMADEDHASSDVRARVHSGTANFAAFLSVPDALDFHARIGAANKEARLRRLRDLWTTEVRGHDRIRILTPEDPAMHAGITSFRLEGRVTADENIALARQLLDEFNIYTVHRTGLASGACVRVTPGVFTSDADVFALRDALLAIA
jgi:selenocysteine lyase/cysteine desulfurase